MKESDESEMWSGRKEKGTEQKEKDKRKRTQKRGTQGVRGHHWETVSFTVRVWGASQRQCDGESVREQHKECDGEGVREQHRECDSEGVRGHYRETMSLTVRV